MMSSNVFSAVVKPSLSARSVTKSRGQPETMPMMVGSGTRLIRAVPLGQADRDAVEQALAGVVVDQEFADRLLRAVARQRRVEEFVVDLLREWRAEHRDRGREHQPRLVAAAGVADGVDQISRAVEIDPVALVEFGLGLTGDDCGEMKEHLRPMPDQRRRSTWIGKIGSH